jgi:hypothetical protein
MNYAVRHTLFRALVGLAGWAGATAQPAQIGSGTAADENAIARWDVVPYQTVTGTLNLGVVAFHVNGMSGVGYAVDGGPLRIVSAMSYNPHSRVVEYWTPFKAAAIGSDVAVEVRAIAFPVAGVPRVLPSLPLVANAGGTLPSPEAYIALDGDDDEGDGTRENPFATAQQAGHAMTVAHGSANNGTIYLLTGGHQLGTYNFSKQVTTTNSWLTIRPAPGLSGTEAYIAGQPDGDNIRTKLLRLYGMTMPTGVYTSNTGNALWCDHITIVGPGRTVATGDWFGSSGFDIGSFFTNCDFSKGQQGISGTNVWFARDCRMHELAGVAYSGCGMVVNCTADYLDNSGTTTTPTSTSSSTTRPRATSSCTG